MPLPEAVVGFAENVAPRPLVHTNDGPPLAEIDQFVDPLEENQLPDDEADATACHVPLSSRYACSP